MLLSIQEVQTMPRINDLRHPQQPSQAHIKPNLRARRPDHRNPNYWRQDDAAQTPADSQPGFFARLLAKLFRPLRGVP
ncbi:MAG: hypothetical protein EOO40_00245 [Deltaproteobacteria bacterium]|nr:MAG: hypothetical protein EOO40_00245 [Deltaproteobacteria bacterium]